MAQRFCQKGGREGGRGEKGGGDGEGRTVTPPWGTGMEEKIDRKEGGKKRGRGTYRVLKKTDEVSLCSLLKRQNGCALETQVGLEVLCDLPDEALREGEGGLSDRGRHTRRWDEGREGGREGGREEERAGFQVCKVNGTYSAPTRQITAWRKDVGEQDEKERRETHLEWQLPNEELGAFLVLANLPQGDRSRPVPMRFLHTPCRRR
jgi:hypothetical protein